MFHISESLTIDFKAALYFFFSKTLFKSIFFIDVSYCEEDHIVPYFTVNKVALPPFHGFWQKTQDSQVRNKRPYYSSAANSISIISLSLPLAPDLMGGVTQMGPGGCLQMQWLVLQMRNLELKEPKLF